MPNYTNLLNLYLPNRADDTIEVDTSLADNFQKIDDAFADFDVSTGVTPEQFGAIGNGVADDTTALQNAINEAQSTKQVLELKAGGIYKITAQLNVNSDLYMECRGYPKAVIKGTGQTFIPIKITGSSVRSTTASSSISANANFVNVASSTSVQRGDIMILKSSASWYYDPRPESTDARKSQLHRVFQVVSSGKIMTEDINHDAYTVPTETVAVDFYRPVKVCFKNFVIENTPDMTPSGLKNYGIRADYITDSIFEEVDFLNNQVAGLHIRHSYNVRVSGGTSAGSNTYTSGYGYQTYGVSHFLIEKVKTYHCRRGVDLSGGNIVSYQCRVDKCVHTGTGINQDGDYYAFNEVGSAGAETFGYGSHGGAINCYFTNNYVSNVKDAFFLRGKNNTVKDNVVFGWVGQYVVNVIYGQDFIVEGNEYRSNTLGAGQKTHTSVSLRAYGAESFVGVNQTVVQASNNHTQISVSGNKVYGVKRSLVSIYGNVGNGIIPVIQNVKVMDNDVVFRPFTNSDASALIKNDNPDNDSSNPVVLGKGTRVTGNSIYKPDYDGATYWYDGVVLRNGAINQEAKTYSFNIANDSVQAVVVGNRMDNAIRIVLDTNEGYAMLKVKEGSSTSYTIGTASKVVTSATFPLTGTTGSADAVTVSLNDGVLHVNNRLGQTEKVHVTVMNVM